MNSHDFDLVDSGPANVNDLDSVDLIQNASDETNGDELLEYFKPCVVQNDREELKQKLADSIEFRRKILSNPPEPIHKIFSFYFVDPELVAISIFPIFSPYVY